MTQDIVDLDRLIAFGDAGFPIAHTAADEIASLRAQVAALTVDAERWRWLRDEHEGRDSGETFCVFEPDLGANCLHPVGSMPGELDAAIDSARSAHHE
jgi:hypothetical protein